MKRFFALILLFLAVFTVSCNTSDNNGSSSNADTNQQSTVEDIAFTGGEASYCIVRPDLASDKVKDATAKLYTSLRRFDENITTSIDWVAPGKPIPEYEIIIGMADREEVQILLREVPYEGYLVKVVGKKLIILAVNDEYIANAVDYVLEQVQAQNLILKSNYYVCKNLNEGGHPLSDAVIGNTKLVDYSIYSKKSEFAKMLQKQIGEATGAFVPIATEESDEPQLVVGVAANENADRAKYYEFSIDAKEDDVYFYAYGENEYGHAFKVFLDNLKQADGHKIQINGNIASYKLPARDEYIKDPSKLYMLWDYLWETPEWMLDYNDKKMSLFGGKGSEKLYASAHRGELIFYPENSIEAVISTYYMGAAIAELDIGATKDGVLVLMHDDTLSRTTNCSDFIGKAGYPRTDRLSEWTYAQLMDLNLKEGGGGSDAKITPFKIPTLEEALTVCKGRLFIVPDKYANWQYVRSTDIMQGSKAIYLSDAMKKTGNYESILISYGNSGTSNYLNRIDAVKLQSLLKAETGTSPFILLRCGPESVRLNYDYFVKNAEKNSFALQLNGDYRTSTNYGSAYNSHGDKVSFLAWTIGTGDSWNDYVKNWREMYKQGLRVIMTNDLFGLVQYCAEVGEKTMQDSNG